MTRMAKVLMGVLAATTVVALAVAAAAADASS
jgi:hypothetical protein